MSDATIASPAGMRPLRVVMASDWHAKYMTPLARGMAEHGAAVKVLTRDHDLEFGGETGVRVEPGTMARWVAGELGGLGEHLQLSGRVREVRALPAVWRIRRQVRRPKPDVVHFQDSAAQDVRLLYASGAAPHRYAVTVHDVVQHPGDQVRGPRTAWVRERLIANAGLLFVHSEGLRDALMEQERPSAPIVVIPHGMPTTPALPLPDGPSLLFFGRISRYKGIDVLLDAMRLLWQRIPDARLVIAGGGVLPVHELLLDPRVTVRNEHVPETDVAMMFAGARCVVLPYVEASQSGVGARAKGFGRPLVVTRVGALPELVSDGSGRVVDSGDADALADSLYEVLATPDLAERMGATAHVSAAETSWTRVGELTLHAYRRHLLR